MSTESSTSFITQANSVSNPLFDSQDSFISQPTTHNTSNSSGQLLNDSTSESQSVSRGWINEHFTKVMMDARYWRVCQAPGCEKKYAATSSTIVFKRHWQRSHSKSIGRSRTRFLFHDSLHINRLVKAIIDLHLDFSVVEKSSFRQLMDSMNPNRPLVGRKTISEILLRSRSKLKNEIADLLSNVDSVALTFDLWSARKGSRGFGCLTAHYISPDWELEELILQFKQMSYPHDAETIKKYIKKTIEANSLDGKVISITTDNASNNVAAIRLMDNKMKDLNLDMVHYKCIAHIIDLGLRVALTKLTPIVTPVREVVLAIRSSRKRKEKFITVQSELIEANNQNSSSPLELAEDVDHRWNSAFILIERAVKLEKAIDIMMQTTKGLETLERIDWEDVKCIMEFLRPFFEATKRFCSTSKVTISVVSSIIPKLIDHCARSEVNINVDIQDAARSLREKLTAYETEIYNPVVNLAYFLDPRYKTKNLSDEMTRIVSDKLKELMDKIPDLTTPRTETDTAFCDDTDDEEPIDEVNSYLSRRREKSSTDIVNWWKLNSNSYPKLAYLARRLLPIQSTSVASERVFSIAGDVDTRQRNRLSDEMVENIVLFKSWLAVLNLE